MKLTMTKLPVSSASLVLLMCLASFSSGVHAQAMEGAALNGNMQRCLSDGEFDPEIDYFPSKWAPTIYQPAATKLSPASDEFVKFDQDSTTDLFDVEYFNHYKIVTNHFVNKTYLLYLCGTEPPASELDGRHQLVLPIPHTGGLAVTQTTQISSIELLGLRNQIKGYIGDSQWVSSPCLNHMLTENTTEKVFDPSDPYNTSMTNPVVKDFMDRHEDILIVGGPYFDPNEERTVIAAETQERTNVATFDWIGFYAAFFNLEGMSNRIVEETKGRYECSSSNAAALASDKSADERPVMLWANYFVGYNWSVAECLTWDATYYCEYAMHCGAKIISRPEGFGWNNPDFGGRYWYVNDDQLLELGKDADVFVYPSNTWDSVYEEKKDILDQIKAVQNKQVYDVQGPGPNMWHEQRLAEYDVVALDFCELVGNVAPGSLHKQKWFRNIFTEPIGNGGTCNAPEEIDEPYVAVGADCTPIDGEPLEAGTKPDAESSTEPAPEPEPERATPDDSKPPQSGTTSGAESGAKSLAFTAKTDLTAFIASLLGLAVML